MPDRVSLLTAANRRPTVSLIVAFVGWLTPAGLAQQFEKDIAPIFKARCIRCHNDRARTSGLSLESQGGILAGGNRGAVVEPGKPDASRLIQAVKHSGDLKMPPDGKLADEQIALLGRWVSAGLPGLKLESAGAARRPGADH